MSENAGSANSYIRCEREVQVDNPPLVDFLRKAQTIADTIFGPQRGIMVRLPATWHDELEPGFAPTYEGASISRADIFAAKSLRTTLFERGAPATQEVNRFISRAYSRVTAPNIRRSTSSHTTTYGKRLMPLRDNPLPKALRIAQSEYAVGSGQLTATVFEVVDSTKAGAAAKREYSFQIGKNSVAGFVLRAQARIIEENLKQTPGCQALFRGEFTPDGSVLHVPFAHIPDDGTDKSKAGHSRFVESISGMAKGITIELDTPEWVSKIRTASDSQ